MLLSSVVVRRICVCDLSATTPGAKVQEGQNVEKNQGVARAISVSPFINLQLFGGIYFCNPQSFIDPSLSWDDIPWFQSVTKSKPGFQIFLES